MLPSHQMLREAVVWLCAMLALAATMLLCLTQSGCASITPTYDPDTGRLVKVEASKFLADLRYEESVEYGPDGKTTVKRSVKYETETNADKIMNSANALFGTLVDGAGKVMP